VEVPEIPPVIPAEPPSALVGVDHLTPSTLSELKALEQAFQTVRTQEDLAAAYRTMETVAPKVENELAGDKMCYDLDFSKLVIPGMQVGCVAEGTMVQLRLDSVAWTNQAAKSTGAADDRFFDFMFAARDNGRFNGWPAWIHQTWDYGGCSALGDGVILNLLKKADAARDAGPLFEAEVVVQRGQLLEQILSAEAHAPYCGADLEARPDAVLQDEARQVLAEVNLSPEEKSSLETVIPKLKGEIFQGG